MNMLILNSERQTELTALNPAGSPLRQLCAIPLMTGDAALSATLLSDCGAGQTWEHYGGLLRTLPISNVSSETLEETQIT